MDPMLKCQPQPIPKCQMPTTDAQCQMPTADAQCQSLVPRATTINGCSLLFDAAPVEVLYLIFQFVGPRGRGGFFCQTHRRCAVSWFYYQVRMWRVVCPHTHITHRSASGCLGRTGWHFASYTMAPIAELYRQFCRGAESLAREWERFMNREMLTTLCFEMRYHFHRRGALDSGVCVCVCLFFLTHPRPLSETWKIQPIATEFAYQHETAVSVEQFSMKKKSSRVVAIPHTGLQGTEYALVTMPQIQREWAGEVPAWLC